MEGIGGNLIVLRQDAEGLSTSSNGSSSSESFGLSDKEVDEEAMNEFRVKEDDVEVEEGKEVNQIEDQVPTIAAPIQILVVEPILVLSSAFEAANDLSFPIVAPAAEDLIYHSFNQSGGAGTSLEEVDMAFKPKTPGPTDGQSSMPSSPFISKPKGKLLS
ncbi:hypothetical protein Acr_10g0007320 [Actinidia rufa]|uniref:Uncharacterized protein n=1 Tax=Actinidia rufa TaxID=165716 RepID=A0A7J0FBT1_9ERIC|nr:hypothetical protein Acr_10g0007320 [Actinidia rufa]